MASWFKIIIVSNITPAALVFAIPSLLIAGGTPTNTILSCSPNGSVYGKSVSLAAVVTPPTASGRVTFYDGTVILGTIPVAAGQAQMTTSLLESGIQTLRAIYSGDANYASSVAAVTQNVITVPGGGFPGITSYNVGFGSLVVWDFNGDGKPDLATQGPSGSTINVFLGVGDGTFGAPITYSLGTNFHAMVVSDFNQDGKPDLAVATSNGISVLPGNGDGTFGTPVSTSASPPTNMFVSDFNGDGTPDLAAESYTSGAENISVLLGNGDGTFRTAGNLPIGADAAYIAVADVNGDGIPDLAIATTNSDFSGYVSILLGNGDGSFKTLAKVGVGEAPSSILAADLNGDGKDDLAVGNYLGSSVSILLGNGDGTFQPASNYPAGPAPVSIATGDFNGDGKPDLAVATDSVEGTGYIDVLLGNGDGSFQQGRPYESDGTLDSIVFVGTADFNGDGRADLVTTAETFVNILLAVPAATDLSITINHPTFNLSNTLTYAITVSNVGYAPSTGLVTVSETLPQTLVATGISGTGWNCVLTTLTCSRSDSLAALTSYPVINLTLTKAANSPSAITIAASVSGGGQAAAATSSDFRENFTPDQISQAWSLLNPSGIPQIPGAALLMTDGTVMVQRELNSTWYRLTPDANGSYINGTWTQAATMPSGYNPYAFASAVLADGRLVVIGGEYNGSSAQSETSLGAIYDPRSDTWTSLPGPAGFGAVGDSQSVVLPDGRFLLTNRFTGLAALDPNTLAWTILKGTNKADYYGEEGWTLLPDGSVLTLDVSNGRHTERYLPQMDTWVSAGDTPVPLAANTEIGPQVLRADGTVFVAGATGHTATYNALSGAWTAGPDFPFSSGAQLATSDAPAVLLPSGNVLVQGSGTNSANQTSVNFFFEFDGTRLNPVPTPNQGLCGLSMLTLPTGQILCTVSEGIYTPSDSPDPSWLPTISSAPAIVQPGLTYAITGTQFNGLSQAVGFGDDYQAATNYPLVRIVNSATGHVFYCRTHNHSTMGVATGSTSVSTEFDVPASIETGPSTLFVVANGIASKAWGLTIAATQPGSLPQIAGVVGAGLSVPAVTAISANGYFAIFGSNFAPAGTSRQIASGDIVNGFLPTNLSSTCVNIGTARAFLTFVSSGQINAIAPNIASTGSASVSVVTNCGSPNETISAAATVRYAVASPEFLYWVQNADGNNPVIAVDATTGEYIGPPGLIPGLTFRAARAGDVLTIYGIGFGNTESGPVPGTIPSVADSVLPGYSITIGSTPVQVSYVGVTPTVAGLYQVNLTVPSGLAPGNYSIVLDVSGVSTPAPGVLAVGQ